MNTTNQDRLMAWIEAIDKSVCTSDPEALRVPGDIALAWATVTLPEVRQDAEEHQIATCEQTLAAYGTDTVDLCIAQLLSAGFLEAVPCSCADCDGFALVPSMPVCEGCRGDG